jgi:hypothetical protein
LKEERHTLRALPFQFVQGYLQNSWHWLYVIQRVSRVTLHNPGILKYLETLVLVQGESRTHFGREVQLFREVKRSGCTGRQEQSGAWPLHGAG